MEQPILSFMFNYLNDLHIQHTLTSDKSTGLAALDLGLRDTILKRTDPPRRHPVSALAPNTIYHVEDYYQCCYSFFACPDSDSILYIGPYLSQLLSEAEIQQLMDELQIPSALFPQLNDYYLALPYLPEKHSIHTLIRHFYQSLTHADMPASLYLNLRESESREDFLDQHQFRVSKDPVLSMHMLETRYQAEDELLSAVAAGNTSLAMKYSNHMDSFRISPRTGETLRDQKNLTIVLNTLMRRTAYEAGVHPLYIDAISGNYARMIEQCRNLHELNDIVPYMIQSYCNLVAKKSLSAYSEPVRHILVTVDASLTADLSLKRFADELFLNSSYLSALFKKEVGMTLTDYVNHSRLTYAKKLLKSTQFAVQDVAIRSGFSDIHYFTRLFRREYNMSPREWRNLR
jgi:AraC-like DNA-binding protein